MICQLIVNARLPLAKLTKDKMTAAVKIMFLYSKIASGKALFLLHSLLMIT